MTVPRPLKSPEPPTVYDEHPSGSHNIATIREAVVIADAAAEVERKAVTRIITSADVKWFVASCAAVAIATGGGLSWGGDKIDGGVKAGVAPLERRVGLLEQNQTATMTEVREMRLDLREAYKAQRYDRSSPRLEKPPPPVPALDGGS